MSTRHHAVMLAEAAPSPDPPEAHGSAEGVAACSPLDRSGLLDALARHIADPAVPGAGRLTLVLFRLADLRAINEGEGISAGDALLAATVARLTTLDGFFAAARLGGAVFAACTTETTVGRVLAAVGRATADLEAPVQFDAGEVASRVEVGCAFWPEDATRAERLLLAAETALSEARAGRASGPTFHLAEMGERRADFRYIARDLSAALDQGALTLAYQPIQDLRTDRIVAVEALARWTHPERGAVPPSLFVPAAERNGLIGRLGRYVLRRACTEIAAWRRDGLPDLRISVNVSPDEFIRPEIVETIAMALYDSELPPTALILELTEGIIVRDADAAGRAMERLAKMGVTLALDDFGAGYASFAHLRRFPIHELKMDRCLIAGAEDRAADRALAEAVVSLGHDLGLVVVAEGVETAEQRRWLRDASVDLLQGYFLARPMPGPACHAFCTKLEATAAATIPATETVSATATPAMAHGAGAG